MSDEKKDPEAEELPSEATLDTSEPVKVVQLGVISDPAAFELAWDEANKAVMIVFPQEDKTLSLGFQGPAGEKFLTAVVVLLNLLFNTGRVERESDSFFEVPEKKNPTLH